MSVARSWLYVPGDRRDRLDGAPGRGADALILDLEDSVAATAKDDARRTVAAWLGAHATAMSPELWVRVNADSLTIDVAAVVGPGLTGVVVPKAETAVLDEVSGLLSAREQELGLTPGRFAVVALIETATGLLSAPQLAAAPRVVHLGIGEADLAAQLRLRPSPDRSELMPLRLKLVVASAAARIGAPLGPTATDFRDLDALRRSTEALLRTGFRARTAIHPAQVAVLNDVFSPTPDEVEEARELLEGFDRAESEGSGVVTDARGRMVDVAVVRSAREVLTRAESTAPSAG